MTTKENKHKSDSMAHCPSKKDDLGGSAPPEQIQMNLEYIQAIVKNEIDGYTSNHIAKPEYSNLSQLFNTLSEFLNNYIIFGHTLDGDEFVYDDALQTKEDINAVKSLLFKFCVSSGMV